MMSTDQISPDTQVALLLTGRFGRSEGTAKPLTPSEYNRVAKWLHAEGLRPGDLLEAARDTAGDRDSLDGVPSERVESLLRRGASMAVSLERWAQRGIRVIGRTDPDYPPRWTERLRARRPPVVFGVGAASLACTPQRRVAVVGSRNASPASNECARKTGERCAEAGFVIVSGGAKGIDESAMLGCLQAGGEVVGILASKLESAATSKKWRDGLREKRLLLLSEVSPSAPFTVGNAMSRNRLVYSFADVAVVASSGVKGGTWEGSRENLKHGWIPLLVRNGAGSGDGAAALLEAGALPLDDCEVESAGPFARRVARIGAEWSRRPATEKAASTPELALGRDPVVSESAGALTTGADVVGGSVTAGSFWELFLDYLAQRAGDDLSERAVAEDLDLPLTKVREWLNRAVDEGLVARETRPVRYRVLGKTLWQDV